MNKTLFTKIFSASLIVMLALAAMPVTPARAATIVVNTTTDEDTAVGSNCSLREAIIAANTDTAYNDCTAGAGSDTITLTSGSIYELTLVGGGQGDLDITTNITITTTAAGIAIIDPTTPGFNERVFDVSGAGSLTLDTIRITTAITGNAGAAVQSAGTLVVQDNSEFISNQTNAGGGGSNGGAINITGGTASISNSTFSGNTATGDGGAISVSGGTLTVTSVTFTNTTAANSADNGGAIYHNAATVLTLTNSSFTGNTSTNGDGGAIMMDNNGSSLTLSGSTFTSNRAEDDAGAIFTDGEPINISSSTFTSNTAGTGAGGAADGGAIRISGNSTSATSRINLSTFTNNSISMAANQTLHGGAIANDGTVIIANVTFSGNFLSKTSAGGGDVSGGAVYSNGITTLHNSTFSGNSVTEAGTGAASGGSIFRDAGATGAFTVANTILNSGNENAVAGNCGGTITNGGNNITYSANDCGAGWTNSDPLLGALTGSPQYFPLNTGSPAINTGSNAICATATSTNNQSQNGLARPQGVTCDIGSYEAPANTAPTVQAIITDVIVNEDAANTVFSLYPNFQDAQSADNLLTYTVTAISNTALFTAPAGALPIAIADPTNFTLDYAPNANGVSNVTIRATDPGGLFVEDTFQVTVNAVNDEPSFTASNPPAVNEDAGAQTVSGWATVASFGAPNESGQAVLAYNISGSTCGTLLSAGPAVSTAGVLTYTPAANANGTCNFNVAVQDNGGIANGGDDTSPTQNFTITVNAVNDAPTGGNGSVTTNEDVIYTFTLADLTTSTTPPYADVDGNLFAGIRVTSLETAGTLQCGGVDVPLNGTCADVTTLTFAPAANANGSPYATFQFQVYDGTAYSASSYTMTINVTAVNDEPSFGVSGPIPAVDEDAGAVSVPGWIVLFNRGGGPDEAGQTVLNWLVTNSTCGSLLSAGPSVAGNTLSYTTAANANGTCTFDLQVQDNGGTASGGDDTSPANNYTITVNAVNDAPSFTASNPPAVNEDAGAQTVNAWASFNPGGGTDESAQTATYSVTNAGSCATLLSAGPAVSTAGVLTYTPAANQNGSCTFDVSVQDSGSGIAPNVNTSGTQNFTITVNALNDNPTGGNDAVTMLEDTTYTFQTTDFTYNDVEGSPFSGIRVTTLESAGTLQCGGLDLNINDTCADVTTLTFAPVANENGAPYATFQFQVSDGGLFSTSSYTMTINVTAVNDEPSFTASNPPAVNEDAGAQNIAGWATFNPGNTSEAGQTATFNVSNLGAGCATLLTGSPTINASGDLSYTPATNQNGTCTFDVSVQDSGGTTNGGDDTSGTQNFTITINAVNDEPAQSVAPDQFRTDAITVIPQGGLTNETSVVFKATAIDPEAQQYQLEVEVVSDINPFTGTPTCTSPLTNSGTEASTGSCGPFAPGSYIWRYRFVDSGSAASAWTVFGASDPDFIIDNGSPTVTNVTSSTANGTYFSGDIISIQVTFNEIVNVTGTPQLLLELGAVDGLANYVSGSGTNTLTFTYTIVVGDNTPDLDYVAANSLTLNGGSIQDAAFNNASLTLPNPGSAGSLGANKDIVIDALILVVVNNGVGSVPDTGDGSLSENEQVASSLNITQLVVRFNKDVRDVPSSTTDPDEVDNPANYILVRSNTAPVGNFNTISCAGGVVAPDIQTLVTSVTYTNGGGTGPFEATLTLSAPLTTDGYYRLYVCGTTSIVQANNPTLALAGNNTTNGTDFIRNFQITTAPVGGGGNDNDNGPRLNVAALPATGFAPNRVTVLPEQPAERAYAELGDLWIEIPALGVKTSIVGVPQTAEGEWDVAWLANNVGWLNGTAFPTWEGNSVVTAHVTNADGLNGPFSNLKKLKFGDQIIVHAYGEKYTFEVRASRLTRPFATNYAFEDLEEHSYLTLITCQTYLPKTDTYLFRRVVRAVLVSVESE